MRLEKRGSGEKNNILQKLLMWCIFLSSNLRNYNIESESGVAQSCPTL